MVLGVGRAVLGRRLVVEMKPAGWLCDSVFLYKGCGGKGESGV